MRKQKLKKFGHYVHNMLPHEAEYLHHRIKFTDPERISIMRQVYQSVCQDMTDSGFDATIDKRKYSKLLLWMQDELDRVDVDLRLQWIIRIHQKILLDVVTPEIDAEIVKQVRRYLPHQYYFRRFYEMLNEYRHYLQIRMRYQSYQRVHDFLERYRLDYQQSRLVHEQIHQATADIVGTSQSSQREAIHWKQWLHDQFNSQNLDGHNRYMCAIRYIFICLRYGMLPELKTVLDQLDTFFDQGHNYSRRLLVNYYDNLLVYYDRARQYEEAKRYGYLSIKTDHPDALIYRNNLVNVLLKCDQYQEALRVIEAADFKIKSTKNMHSVIGFVANHIKCLVRLDRLQEAVNKGRVFLQAYDRQIIKYRWHRYFAAYHGALLSKGMYAEIIKNGKRYSLRDKEQQHKLHGSERQYILSVYEELARYQAGTINKATFVDRIHPLIEKGNSDYYDQELLDRIEDLIAGA